MDLLLLTEARSCSSGTSGRTRALGLMDTGRQVACVQASSVSHCPRRQPALLGWGLLPCSEWLIGHVLLLWHGTLVGILNASLVSISSAYTVVSIAVLPFYTSIASACSCSFTWHLFSLSSRRWQGSFWLTKSIMAETTWINRSKLSFLPLDSSC